MSAIAHLQPAAARPAHYEFTNAWFAPHEENWRELIDSLKPTRLLEVGCYEGRATTFMIEAASRHGEIQITCVDTWAGSVDLPPAAMAGVEARFDRNTALALGGCTNAVTFRKLKLASAQALACFVGAEGEPFDLIYIDGSHTAPDVLTDAVLAFRLLRVGGVMVFDDYTWCMEPAGAQDPLNMPKFAIDTFVNMFIRKIAHSGFGAGHAQYAVRKVSQ